MNAEEERRRMREAQQRLDEEVPKLFEERNLAMTRLYLLGEGTHKELGAEVGLSPSAARNAVNQYTPRVRKEIEESLQSSAV